MTMKEVMGSIHSKYPNLVTHGDYSPPTHRCTRWILLSGPAYRTPDQDCSVLLDASKVFDWAVKNSSQVGYSVEAKEAAKNFFPEWVRNADVEDETVTLLDPWMHQALKDWDLDLVVFGWAKVWCSACRNFTGVFGKAQDEFQRTQNKLMCLSYLPDWKCEEGHMVKQESTEPIRFF